MSRVLKLASAAVVAAVVETASVWLLTHVVVLSLPISFAIAFAVGYVALLGAILILGLASAISRPAAQLRTYGPYGIALILLVEAVVYVCAELLGLNLTTTNAAALVAVVCWVALGWPFVCGDVRPNHRPPDGRGGA